MPERYTHAVTCKHLQARRGLRELGQTSLRQASQGGHTRRTQRRRATLLHSTPCRALDGSACAE